MSLKRVSEKAHKNKKHHSIVSILAGLAVCVVLVFVAFSIINDSIDIRDNQKKYEELKRQTESVEEDNEKIQTYLDDDAYLDKYIEDMARNKFDFANSDERIYYVIPASGE
ncbi:MAG: septum formation initiator family protein [Oscillospiraceae bacterium]